MTCKKNLQSRMVSFFLIPPGLQAFLFPVFLKIFLLRTQFKL